VSFLEESAATPKGALAWITRCQVCLFFPLLLLEGLNLHAKSIRSLGSRTPVKGRWIELGMLAARFMIYFGLIFWLLPFGMAWAFIGVQLAVFGLYMARPFRRITKAYLSRERPLEGRRLVNGLDQESLPCPVVRWEALDRAPRGRPYRASRSGEASYDAESSELVSIRSKNRYPSRSWPHDRPRSGASPTRTRRGHQCEQRCQLASR